MTPMQHATLAVLAVALASCSTRPPAPQPVVPPRPQPLPAPAPAAASPADFVATAGSIDLFVVRASELVLARSNDPDIRALATQLRAGHRGLAAQLSMAGRRLDALPAASLQPREAGALERLDAQPAIDRAFVAAMTQAHQHSLALHAAFAARGSSATLRPVAANGERVERADLFLLAAR